jgi:hypothetical protein
VFATAVSGWGGEDDDLWHRLRLTGLLKKPKPRPTPPPTKNGKKYRGPKFWPPEIERPPKGRGQFTPISEAQTVHVNQKSHNQWNRIGYMLELMQNNSHRWQKDGLSDLRMTLTQDATTVTHVDSIDVMNRTSFDTIRGASAASRALVTTKATTTSYTRKHFVTAKQSGSIVNSLAIDPTALASFAAIHHLKAIPKITALEYLHITSTNGGRVERAGAAAGIAWGACHYRHAREKEMKCPDIAQPELEGKVKMRGGYFTHTPWHSPLQDFEENPYKDRPTFTVVRNPYERLIELFYCPWHGYKGLNAYDKRELNIFVQNALYPPKPPEDEKGKEGGVGVKVRTLGDTAPDEVKGKVVGTNAQGGKIIDMGTKPKKEEPEKKKEEPKKTLAEVHLRPQFHYVFANNKIETYSDPFVTHVLRFENLEQEFPELMKLYGLDYKVRLPVDSMGVQDHNKIFTPKDFDAKTLEMIHRFYRHDFDRFGYERIPLPPTMAPTLAPTLAPSQAPAAFPPASQQNE